MLGLKKPDSGEIFIDNIKLNSTSVLKLRQKIFYLDQDVPFGDGLIEEIISNIFKYKHNSHLELDWKMVYFLFREFHLSNDLLKKNIRDLSGGERQRLGIIIGLLLNRDIYLLDEPTSALDPDTKTLIAKAMINLDKTVIINSHDKCWESFKKLELK